MSYTKQLLKGNLAYKLHVQKYEIITHNYNFFLPLDLVGIPVQTLDLGKIKSDYSLHANSNISQ